MIFTLMCFVLNVCQNFLGISDLSIIAYGIPAAYGELGVHTAVVVHKAQKENQSKARTEVQG